MLTLGVIILEHPMSGVVLKFSVPAGQSKIHQDWTIVCWRNEADDWTQLRKEKITA